MILAQVYVAVLAQTLEDRLNAALVANLRRANESVVGNVVGSEELLPARYELVGPGLRSFAVFCGGVGDILAVFVRACEKKRPFERTRRAREYVCNDRRVGVPDMRIDGVVLVRRGDVEGAAHRLRRCVSKSCALSPPAEPRRRATARA
jgi:hypothetical protein